MRHAVIGAALCGRFPGIGVHGAARERLKGEGGDKLRAALGHHDLHCGAFVLQSADQFAGFIGGNAAGDTNDEVTMT